MAIKVRVQNFQSIKDATLVVDGFTAITGPNNTGKSAFLRALQGLFRNTRGSSFVRHGATHCTVCVTFEDGKSVTWEKGKSVNRYRIDAEDWLEKVSHGVPEPVVDVLRVHAVDIGATTVWPQVGEQFNGQVFLLDKPGSVLAEAISDVERVGRLNKALTVSESDRRKVRSKLQLRKQDEEQVQLALVKFRGLDAVGQEIEKLTALQGQAIQAKNLLSELTSIREVLSKERGILSRLEGVERISLPSEEDFQEIRKGVQNHQVLQDLQEKLVKGQQDVRTMSQACEALSGVDLGASFEEPARKAMLSLATLLKLKGDLFSAQRELAQSDADWKSSVSELELATKDFQVLLKELPACPTCGNVLGEAHAH
jgi:DNA repair ATPase RecN